MDHLLETMYCECNNHVTDDVTWLLIVKVVTSKYLGASYYFITVQDRLMRKSPSARFLIDNILQLMTVGKMKWKIIIELPLLVHYARS